MLQKDPDQRPSASDLLKTYLKSEVETELEFFKTLCGKLVQGRI